MTAQIDEITIYIALATIGNFLLLFLNLLMFAFLLKKIRNLTRDETAFNSKYTKIISEANDQATLILNKATKESEAMINETRVNLSGLKKELINSFNLMIQGHSDQMKGSLEEINKDYSKFATELKDQMQNQTRELANTVINKAGEQLNQFVETLKQATIQAQIRFESGLNTQFQQALDNIRSYRQEQLTLVEKSINTIILKVTKAVLPEAISITEHEQLIFEALDKAKKEETFENIISANITSSLKVESNSPNNNIKT